jgi:glutaconyl-CoA/methylmalonyl-CoA decarboxylase subunit gamma
VTFEIKVGGRTRRVEVRGKEVLLDGRTFHVDVARAGHVWSLLLGAGEVAMDSQATPAGHTVPTQSYEVSIVERTADDLIAYVNGRQVPVTVVPRNTGRHGDGAQPRSGGGNDVVSAGSHRVLAPMPGRIAKVLVTVGDVVAVGQGLVVVEAMKMENELRSPGEGVVTEVAVVEGALVQANTVLVVVSC